MQQVVRNYPRSDESTLATEWLAHEPRRPDAMNGDGTR